jgi:hypothetical protein
MPPSTRRGALRVGTVLVTATAVTLVDAAPALASRRAEGVAR